MAEAGADAGFFRLPHKTIYDARPGRVLDPALANHASQVSHIFAQVVGGIAGPFLSGSPLV